MNVFEELIQDIFPTLDIDINTAKSYIGFLFDKKIVFKIMPRKEYCRLEIKHFDNEHKKLSHSEFDVYVLQQLSELSEYKEQIETICEYLGDRPTDEAFSCCSRYEECSNAKKCINPIERLRRNCGYRKNLEQGIIFYGVNKNI